MSESMHEKMMRKHGGAAGTMPEMKKLSYEIGLKSKKQIAEGTMTFTFEKPGDFKFRAGQHVRMTLINPPETDAEGDSRFFSLACTPGDKDLVFAMRMRDTAFKRVLKNMQPGKKVLIQILVNPPHGAFALHEDSSKPAVYIVGGIGIVPAYSMIKDATERKLPHKLFLFYSNRRPEDAPFLKELQILAKQNPNFTLTATMTEAEKSAQAWQGETSHIDQAMLKKYLPDFSSPIYYVSGLPEMVSAMKSMLKTAGASDEAVKAEEFEGFDLNKLSAGSNSSWKNYLLIGFIILLLLAVLMIHLGAGLPHGLGSFSLNNPASYLTIAVVATVVIIKVSMVVRLRRALHKPGHKISAKDVLKAHNPIQKR